VTDIDLAIVGAGPAGALAAYRLARGGARVALFDASHPREKPCGGGVTGRALALVHDVLPKPHVKTTPITSARFTNALAAACGDVDPVVDLGSGALLVVSRSEFDAALLDAARGAGAEFVAARVRDIAIDRTCAELTTDRGVFRAGIVVGADGATSLVRRRVGRAFTRAQLSIAAGFFARGATSGEIVLEMTGDPPGYLWSFPRVDHLAIGVCAQADVASAPSLRATAAAWIDRIGAAPGAPLEPYSWPIPSLSTADFDADRVTGSRWALVGDAAGLVDPITREGIFFALASAGWLADEILTSGSISAYEARVRDEAVPELARAARLKRIFFRPAFAALLRSALRESAAIRAVMADLVAGQQPYATLHWRLLGTLELGLAWRTLRLARSS